LVILYLVNNLDRADVEWLLANYADGHGFAAQGYQLLQKRNGLDLRGADLHKVDLHCLPLKGVDLYNAHLEDAYLSEAHLNGLASERLISKGLTSARPTLREVH
jgi:uncharacterized protein YjbI with pentapeptide repeats